METPTIYEIYSELKTLIAGKIEEVRIAKESSIQKGEFEMSATIREVEKLLLEFQGKIGKPE